MNWKDLKDKRYYWDGSWRDIYVHESTRNDWENWINLVNANYKIDWYNGKTERDENKIDYNVILDYWNGMRDYCSTVKVFIDNIQINAHFFDDTEIENDIDPREIISIDDHNRVIDFMTKLSKVLNKPVILSPEKCPDIVLIKVLGDNISINIKSNPKDWPVKTK